MANVRQAGGGGFSEWWNDIPPVTRVLFGLSIGTTLGLYLLLLLFSFFVK